MRKIFYTIILLLVIGNARAQQYNIRNYSDPQEIGQSQIYALLVDSRSYTWLGTQGGGLTQFDGLNFKNFTREDGLPDNYIRSLHESPDGNLWVGTDRGLSVYDGYLFHTLAVKDERTLRINALASQSDGTLWAATDQGLFVVKDSLLQPFSELSRLNNTFLRACLVDQNDQLWVAGLEGLWKIEDRQLAYFGLEEGLTNLDIHALTEDQRGQIWIATATSGVNIYNGHEIIRFDYSDEIEESGVANCIFEDREGQIWIGTSQKGAFVWDPKAQTRAFISVDEGLESPSIQAFADDRWGNIWLGTSGGGLSCYSGRQFLHYNLRNGLTDEHVYAICAENSERVWFGTAKGISLLNRGQLTHFNASTGFKDVKVKALFVDQTKRLWIGTEGKGLAFRDSSGFHWIRSWQGLAGDHVLDILQDSLGHLWVATADAGITELIPDPQDSLGRSFLFERYAQTQGLPDTYIYQLMLDQQKRLWWAGRNRGIGYFDGEGMVLIGKEEGLKNTEVRCLAEDEFGHLWGGMRRGGLFRMREKQGTYQFDYYGKAEGLSSDNIYLLAFDASGDLWAGSEKGVDRLSFDAEQNIIEIRHYGAAEGFQGGETCTNAVDADGAKGLWFGTLRGLTRYLPGTTRKNTQAPQLNITEVRLFYEPLLNTIYADKVDPWKGLVAPLSFPYNQNHLGFSFIGVNHANPEAVDYQWMLQGTETEWSPPRKERTASFANLPPGDYTFLLRAYNEDGVVNENPLQQSFTIRPPFWQTWWFRLAAIATLSLLLFWFIRSRINRIKRRAQREREQLELEKNLLALEQKALQLQMNPHFIFNALNSIQGLITQQDHRTARYQLAKFSKLMRATLENSRSPVISLDQEIETLENYLALEQFSRNNSFDFEILVVDDLDREALQIPPMLIQPFVENAIKHGMAKEVENGKIKVQFSIAGQSLECIVEDNGVGRERATQIKSQQEAQHQSMALQVTRERLELLGAEQRMKIVDLKDSDGKVLGTRVMLKLPLKFA